MSYIILEKVSRNICKILFNRPDKCNAVNLETIKSLQNALHNFEHDQDLRVAILSGIGRNFCAGYDLNELIDSKSALPNIHRIEQMLWPINQVRLSEKKIVIAAIEGHAAGFGYELALKCDFRIADKDSRMGFLNRRFGIPIMNGGTVILPKLIGQARALELIATGKAQLAPEALEYGVITYISDIGCALGRATNLARCLSKFDQSALMHDLRAATIQTNLGDVETLLRLERTKSLEYLRHCPPLEVASKFLRGELCRHGNFDLGNLMTPDPEVTL